MTDRASGHVAGEIVDASATFTLEELCVSCRVEPDWIVALVDHGAIEPSGATRTEWTFAAASAARVAKARRLEDDFGLNAPGIALVLDLLDELDELRSQLSRMHTR